MFIPTFVPMSRGWAGSGRRMLCSQMPKSRSFRPPLRWVEPSTCERYGYVWTTLGQPAQPVVDTPEADEAIASTCGPVVAIPGDLTGRRTNNLCRSTMRSRYQHSARARYWVPFFFDGRFDFHLGCIPSCLAAGDCPRFAPVTVQEHLSR
jgi:hypothetical protein